MDALKKGGALLACVLVWGMLGCLNAERNPQDAGQPGGFFANLFSSSTAVAPCSPCKMFVSTGTVQGNISGLGPTTVPTTNADARCMSDSSYPGTGTYKALLVNGTHRRGSITANVGDGQIDWVLHASTEYRRIDGTTVIGTTGANALFTLPFTNSVHTVFITYWTGIFGDWTTQSSVGFTCADWTDNSGGPQAPYGAGNATDASSLTGSGNYCSDFKSLLCVQQ